MTLPVWTYADYLTSVDGEWSNESHAAVKFVKCIKGHHFNGYANIVAVGKTIRLKSGDRSIAIDAFSDLVQAQLNLKGPTFFVPVPSSKTHIGSPTPSPALSIANSIAQRYVGKNSGTPVDALAWDQPLLSAHAEGGPRHAENLYPRLRVRNKLPKGARVILVDDVKTSGGHLRACAAFITKKLNVNVVLAICLGRSVDSTSPQPLEWEECELEEYIPMP